MTIWKKTNKIYCFQVLNFLFVNNIIMASYIKNLLKQLPFMKKTIKPRIKKFTNAKLLANYYHFLKNLKMLNRRN